MTRSPDAEWHADELPFPRDAGTREQLEFMVRFAILAPSSHNTQPWLFKAEGEQLFVYADRTRALAVVDPHDRELVISCGAAVGTLQVALRHFGFAGDIRLLPDRSEPDLLAVITPGASHSPSAADEARFAAIFRRRTTRLAFEDTAIPPGLLVEVQSLAAAWDVELAAIQDQPRKDRIAELVSQADRLQHADPSFRRELAAWMHSRRSRTRDGISWASFGNPDLLSGVGSLVLRTFDLGKGIAAQDQKLSAGSPLMLVFATPADEPMDWLKVGIAHVQALLAITAAGLKAAYLNQPIEVAQCRPLLQSAAGLAGRPQLLIRAGAGKDVPACVRRPASEVIVHGA